MRFLVTVVYREPTYEAYAGKPPTFYRWTFAVDSADERGAKDEALRRFHVMERLSRVSWVREVIEVCCEDGDVEADGARVEEG